MGGDDGTDHERTPEEIERDEVAQGYKRPFEPPSPPPPFTIPKPPPPPKYPEPPPSPKNPDPDLTKHATDQGYKPEWIPPTPPAGSQPSPAPTPKPRGMFFRGKKNWWRALLVGGGVVAGIVVILTFAGGGSDENDDKKSASPPGTAENTAPTTAAPTSAAPSGGDLASASLPTSIAFVATKTAEPVPPPAPIQPARSPFRSTLTTASSCPGGKCSYTTKMNLGSATVVGAIPDVAWTRNGAMWHLDSVGNYQSSNTGGLQCVYHTAQTWDLTVTKAQKSGSTSVATDWQGTLHWEVRLDEGLSAAAIAEKYCPPYQNVTDWSVVASTNPASLPAG